MITHVEIKNLEVEWSLREDVVEKDYVISWILWGIGSHPALRDAWIFKGGTCLKKCYFETYRFSEDLDFTILPKGPFEPDQVLPILDQVLSRVHEESGIDFAIQKQKMKLRPDATSSEGRVYYRGPRQSPSPSMVKLDLNAAEKIVRPPLLRELRHAFSDRFPVPRKIRCYSFEELFAEKIRALGERCRPRDLYDVVNIFRHSDLRKEPGLVRNVLKEKCESKGIPIPSHKAIMNSPAFPELQTEWESMLAHQLPNLPPYHLYWEVLEEFFNWLEEKVELEVLPPLPPDKSVDISWIPPATVFAWGQNIPLEPIRFAGVNLLCIEIDYRKLNGDRTHRWVEPYSLRRTLNGHILLYAHDQNGNALRSFRVDRILGITVTSVPFRPKYRVEFTRTLPM